MTSRTFRTSLEQYLDPDQELTLSRRRRANLVPAEVLYTYNIHEPLNRVYQHYEEVRQHVVDTQLDLRFIEEESYQILQREGMQHIHIGMMMVRLQVTHRVTHQTMKKKYRHSQETWIIPNSNSELNSELVRAYKNGLK